MQKLNIGIVIVLANIERTEAATLAVDWIWGRND
jgi:hypothetical protein